MKGEREREKEKNIKKKHTSTETGAPGMFYTGWYGICVGDSLRCWCDQKNLTVTPCKPGVDLRASCEPGWLSRVSKSKNVLMRRMVVLWEKMARLCARLMERRRQISLNSCWILRLYFILFYFFPPPFPPLPSPGERDLRIWGRHPLPAVPPQFKYVRRQVL